MPLPAALQRDLQALTDALDGPDADLSGSIATLAASARLAVESYLGLSVLVGSGSDPGSDDVVLTVYDDDADPAHARTSLLLTPPATGAPATGPIVTGVVLYARAPGAFVDLAADARFLDLAGAVDLDRHLPAPASSAASTVLADQSVVNQALGVLLARGNTLEGARVALGERARVERVPTVGAARRILAELDGDAPTQV